jgi:hypothetical protein
MVDCEECGKKLGILQGYNHPALGKRFLVCRRCFDKVDQDMKRWSEFCLSGSFNKELSRIEIQDAWNESISDNPPLQKWFNKLWIKEESLEV